MLIDDCLPPAPRHLPRDPSTGSGRGVQLVEGSRGEAKLKDWGWDFLPLSLALRPSSFVIRPPSSVLGPPPPACNVPPATPPPPARFPFSTQVRFLLAGQCHTASLQTHRYLDALPNKQ